MIEFFVKTFFSKWIYFMDATRWAGFYMAGGFSETNLQIDCNYT